MARKKKRSAGAEPEKIERITTLLAAALKSSDDLIVAHETRPEGDTVIHVMYGKLITPCMLGTLLNRCEIQKEEGSRTVILD